jgi:hypothetical protein
VKNLTPNPTDFAGPSTILGLISEEASAALQSLVPGAADIGAALDEHYGKGKWFLFWDEDLRGRPIRGTISLAYGNETLVVG